MKITVASGKGGTGKTLVAVNLALSVEADQVLDCDVEEPNVYIFLQPDKTTVKPVELLVPVIDEAKCTYCRKCAEFCQFNALFVVGETAMVFPELCHSCGGCKLICPVDAITEKPRSIGDIYLGEADGIELVYGKLNIGEALAVPVISAVKEEAKDEGLVILDSAPGSACPVVETVKDTDFCLMVTEPTPFGLHDLEIATEVVSQLGIPLGVVVNFAGIGDRGVYEFCSEKSIPILMEIPYNRRIAELYSDGIPFLKEMPEWRSKFQSLLEKIKEMTR
ncbi:MAG: ATP-binding protein [Candidatus Bathyarchaeota archaeon]|nr:ATP-binding protein [Candidatus Bathyarchaeota archaeon]